MVLETLSKETLNFYAPRFIVEIENQPPNFIMSKAIIDVTIEEKINEGASFQLTLHDEFDLTTQEFKWLDHKDFDVGNKITIKMGYENDLPVMMMGVITSLEPSFFSSETPTISIGGQDLSYDYMKRTTPERTFVDKSYSEIARIIADEAGLLPIVDETSNYRESVRKNNDETYYVFLQRLQREIDYEFSLEGQTMYFIKPVDDRKEILTLELGKDIISFRPRIRTSGCVSEVEVRGHNPRDPSTAIVGRAAAGSERSQESGRRTASQITQERHGEVRRVITDVIVNSVEHANSIARAELNKLSDTLIEGDVECVGIPQIRTGVNIRIKKLGSRFSGKYYVKQTTHTINESGYRTRFEVKRNAL
jgi:phage protein D